MQYLSSETVHCRWSGELEPVLCIEPGETVVLMTRDTSDNQIMPGCTVDDLQSVDTQRIHPLTGPISIAGAEVGDSLEVDIEKIVPGPYGFTIVPPGDKNFGFVPGKVSKASLHFMDLDVHNGVILFSEHVRLPLSPFLGVMGVAPGERGSLRTLTPGAHGGNMDLSELTAGSRLFLPVFVSGALFSAGDCHAAQGDGEVSGAAVECAGEATLTFHLIKKTGQVFPRAESPTHYITLGFEADLMSAGQKAITAMIDLLGKEKGLDPNEAYALCSAAADLRITQVVNGIVGVHAMLAKNIFL